ncbi:hypothetical protein [Streptomyces sp. S.PB5]|uniref:hypothetical protein n=1 Tax=Streptomyces sp. S.PB5 TaxID=3020844 RepID=UPI0025B1E3CE|nr:hypothetical protein [Streptomyces sp. S.PB5]MDN3027500.1 hypothetical protein [Streptomyces sp. S.PB5]
MGSRALHDCLPPHLKNGFAAVRAATLYLRLATLRSRTLRAAARTFFRLCGALPALRRAVFAD